MISHEGGDAIVEHMKYAGDDDISAFVIDISENQTQSECVVDPAVEDHQAILDAIRMRDAVQAEKLMQAYATSLKIGRAHV